MEMIAHSIKYSIYSAFSGIVGKINIRNEKIVSGGIS
jgi:hypothetical protein